MKAWQSSLHKLTNSMTLNPTKPQRSFHNLIHHIQSKEKKERDEPEITAFQYIQFSNDYNFVRTSTTELEQEIEQNNSDWVSEHPIGTTNSEPAGEP